MAVKYVSIVLFNEEEAEQSINRSTPPVRDEQICIKTMMFKF